jgi:phosphodiesterase/alkaline phosphatase D-like protein
MSENKVLMTRMKELGAFVNDLQPDGVSHVAMTSDAVGTLVAEEKGNTAAAEVRKALSEADHGCKSGLIKATSRVVPFWTRWHPRGIAISSWTRKPSPDNLT